MSEIIKKLKSFQWHHLIFMALIAAVVIGSDGCKSSGKLTKKERKAQIEAAKQQLNSIINGTTTKSFDEQERTVSDIIAKNYNDPVLNDLIIKAQQKLKRVAAEREKVRNERIDAAKAKLMDLLVNKDNMSASEMQVALDKIKADTKDLNSADVNDLIARVQTKIGAMKSPENIPLKTQLEKNMQGIADAGKAGNADQATSLINKTMDLFSAPDAPVLIIISREGNIVDYDKPTTVKRYLNLLKDQGINRNSVDSYLLDSDGKIKELDLIKK
jgi:hypothetical protein